MKLVILGILAFLSLVVPFSAWQFTTIHQNVAEPYMDEIFHVKQIQEYCAGHWTVWDSKITTLPGSYLPAVGLAYILTWISQYPPLVQVLQNVSPTAASFLQHGAPQTSSPLSSFPEFPSSASPAFCTIDVMRFSNTVISLALFWLFIAFVADVTYYPLYISAKNESDIKTLQKLPKSTSASFLIILQSLTLWFLPTISFYYSMVYTDTLALFALLLTALIARRCVPFFSYKRLELSAPDIFLRPLCILFWGLFAVLCRQTNIIWLGFIAVIVLVQLFFHSRLAEHFAPQHDQPKQQRSVSSSSSSSQSTTVFPTHYSMFSEAGNVLKFLFSFRILYLYPFIIIAGCFVKFLSWNNWQVVVGDVAHHSLSVNWAQLVLLLATPFVFIPWFSKILPPITTAPKPRRCCALCMMIFGHLIGLFGVLYGLWAALNSLHAHPFMLSDNRHYVFYLYRRLTTELLTWSSSDTVNGVTSITLMHLVIIPIAIHSFYMLQATHIFAFVLWFLSGLVVLLPASLIEPRYYSVAVIFALLFIQHQRFNLIVHMTQKLNVYNIRILFCCLICLGLIAVSVGLHYVFIFRPFVDPFSGVISRFMP